MALFKNKKNQSSKDKPEEKQQDKALSSSEKKKQAFPKVEAYKAIKSPHVTEKSTDLGEKNKYVFKIYYDTNKIEVKKAIESFYKVNVEKVNIVHIPPKKRRLGRREGWRHGLKRGYKKAIVTLKQGDSIEIIPGS